MDNHVFRHQFPYFSHDDVPVYLDTAATSQKLQAVLDRQYAFDSAQYATVHRAMYATATQATLEYEKVREDITYWLNAKNAYVVFTSGATHALNIVASGLQSSQLKGTKILICESEHHANILPWQRLAKKHQLSIDILPLQRHATFNEECLNLWLDAIDTSCAVVACAHVSNVLGNIYPIKAICKKARDVNAISVIDGTQAVAQISVDLEAIDCDFYAFSGHKMYASTGIGVLVGQQDLLSDLAPYSLGGEMVDSASFYDHTTQISPIKFEAGTPNMSAAIGLGPAVSFLKDNIDSIVAHKRVCFDHLREVLLAHQKIQLLGNRTDNAGIQSFYVEGEDNHQIALQLWEKNIALRFGQHCAMPLFDSLKINSSLRVSLGCYTNQDDIEIFERALGQVLNRRSPISPENEKTDKLLVRLKDAKDWGSKNRLLMHLSKSLNTLSEKQRTEKTRLSGCESQVWLDKASDGKWYAYSDSKTVRGLLAFIISHRSLASSADKMHALLSEYGLSKFFSVGRRNGIAKVVAFIYDKH